MFDLEPGRAHGNSECLGFVAAGNGTAIVIAENANRQAIEAGSKHPFAALLNDPNS